VQCFHKFMIEALVLFGGQYECDTGYALMVEMV
jgi:hypothetical protein